MIKTNQVSAWGNLTIMRHCLDCEMQSNEVKCWCCGKTQQPGYLTQHIITHQAPPQEGEFA